MERQCVAYAKVSLRTAVSVQFSIRTAHLFGLIKGIYQSFVTYVIDLVCVAFVGYSRQQVNSQLECVGSRNMGK